LENTVQFSTNNKKLFGILHIPDGDNSPDIVILMVTGGPQTRVGSHRLYVQLARYLCANGIASFRFDYEGTGDSEGNWVGYKYAGASIQAAIDHLKSNILRSNPNMIIWSLCDGATASLVFAAQNPDRVQALILCNPYLFHAESRAKTFLKYYYIRRVFEISFWKKLISRQFNVKNSVRSIVNFAKTSAGEMGQTDHSFDKNFFGLEYEIPLENVIGSILDLKQKVSYVLSTNDLAAKQFEELIRSKRLKHVLTRGNHAIRYIKNADHTFSSREAKDFAFHTSLLLIREIRSTLA